MLCRGSLLRSTLRQSTMPLRAKITPARDASFQSSQEQRKAVIKELPGDTPNDVLFNSLYGLRTITLNRPNKLNSLDGSMIRKIVPRLQEWTKSHMANVVVIKGEGRAFCAGGDVAALAKQNTSEKGMEDSTAYFAQEYALDHYIATYTKPYVAFIDGITMGGGVGLSVHAPFRIATERTVFAMPETTIGLFPDVGAGFFLPRLDGQLGLYLALTSEQLKGVNVFFSGVATHYLHSSSLADLEARFSELQFRDSDTFQARLQIINSTIEEFTTGLPHDQPISAPVAGEIREAIDFVFQDAHSLEQILKVLDDIKTTGAESSVRDWAAKTSKTILSKSPTSLYVTIQQLRAGRRWTIKQAFEAEYNLAAAFMRHPDFVAGVTSLLIDKPKTTPTWKPDSFAPNTSEAAQRMFTDYSKELPLLEDLAASRYTQYPHSWTSLPSESAVQSYIGEANSATHGAIVDHFVTESNHKLGVKEKVEEILKRKTTTTDAGHVQWKRS